MLQLLSDARLALTFRKLTQSVFVTLFSIPTHARVSTPLFGWTPKMDRVRSVNSVPSVTTFMRPFDFLDSQSSSNLIFGLRPTMLRISKRGKKNCATEDTKYLAARLRKFIQSCQLHIFCDVVQLQYIGTKSYDSNKMLVDIYFALSSFKMVLHHKRRTISLTPDDLFSHFAEFLSLRSPNAMTWSLSLVALFFNILPQKLQEDVELGGCFLPNLSTLTTSLSQRREFQTLWEYSVTSFKSLTSEINRIKKLVASFSIAKHTRDKVPLGEIYFNNASQAEQTIQT